jgi:hypothetical protein
MGVFGTRLPAVFFYGCFAGLLLPCFCFLTVLVARAVLATAFLAAGFFAFLAGALGAGFFIRFAFFAFAVFLVFAGIDPAPPQLDDLLSKDLKVKRRLRHFKLKIAIPALFKIDIRQAMGHSGRNPRSH